MALALLAALAVGADRVAAWVTERSVATAVVLGGTGVSGAHVDIHGFPFLTQLAAGRIDHVTGRLDAGTFGGHTVSDVHLDARGVQSRAPWNVEDARVDGIVTFDTLASLLSEQLGYDVRVARAPEEPDALSLTLTAWGLDLGVVAAPAVVDDTAVAVQVRSLVLGGLTVDASAIPGGLGSRLAALRIPLRLPDGVALRAVFVEPGGLRLVAQAHDVALSQLAR
ncbi:DUF2993 domain-containing protein [Xylanimonas ulmi]|uniref:DUF2993 family protein n=1 Tax=Xylanimonas ulmi TaxID=228973 RepID=A0A4Q7M440_9MICO|nr:DUF2993 domain-containing protein [Xylanibacterium ulmi]RZS62725.1 DUF2993 family protein [Xylanibacterium ulmi]